MAKEHNLWPVQRRYWWMYHQNPTSVEVRSTKKHTKKEEVSKQCNPDPLLCWVLSQAAAGSVCTSGFFRCTHVAQTWRSPHTGEVHPKSRQRAREFQFAYFQCVWWYGNLQQSKAQYSKRLNRSWAMRRCGQSEPLARSCGLVGASVTELHSFSIAEYLGIHSHSWHPIEAISFLNDPWWSNDQFVLTAIWSCYDSGLASFQKSFPPSPVCSLSDEIPMALLGAP